MQNGNSNDISQKGLNSHKKVYRIVALCYNKSDAIT